MIEAITEEIIECVANAIRKIPYLPVAERLRNKRRNVTSEEIYAVWCREQARAAIDAIRKKGWFWLLGKGETRANQ